MDLDLLVLGTDCHGIERAIAAVRAGGRAGIVESPEDIPLDILCRAADIVAVTDDPTIASWKLEAQRLLHQRQLTRGSELDQVGVQRFFGRPRFLSNSSVEVISQGKSTFLSASEFVLASGTRSSKPGFLSGDAPYVVTVETILELKQIPRTVVVIGAGKSGMSVSVLLARLGVEVVVVDEHRTLLELCGVLDDSFDQIQALEIAFRLEDEAIGVEIASDSQVAVRLSSGRVVVADSAVVCTGRLGTTQDLNLDKAGVGVDERGRVWSDSAGRTWNSKITVVGDLIACPQALKPSAFSADWRANAGASASRIRSNDRLLAAAGR